MVSGELIKIDLKAVLASRLGRRARFIPSFIIRRLERLICQDELNTLLAENYPLRGADFCHGVLKSLDITLDVDGVQLPEDSRIIVVSNHPLGGLDGISMIAWLSEQYPGKQVHFLVNDLLMAVDPLRECFVPVNKHGSQSRDYAAELDRVLRSDDPLVIYPAGLVSRLMDDGSISDLTWRKIAAKSAVAYRRDIVPVYFDGTNSRSFYSWARRRVRLGIKFNAEMVLLPREVIRSRKKHFALTVGDSISWHDISNLTPAAATAMLRERVYSLAKKIS